VIGIQEKGNRKEREGREERDEQGQGSDGLGSGEAVHRWDLMGDDRGEAPRPLSGIRRSGGGGDHEGPRHWSGSRLRFRRVCGSSRRRSSCEREAYYRWKNGKCFCPPCWKNPSKP